MLVCHSWSHSFRPSFWRTVVVSSLGPDFSDPRTRDLLRNTRHLEFRGPSDSPLPVQSLLHLTSLKISPRRLDSTAEQLFWSSITEVVHILGTSNFPLFSIEICLHQGTAPFWEALLTCTKLTSLTLSNLHIERFLIHKFWLVASTVESITLRNATTQAHSHPFRPHYRTPFVRLRHLVLKGTSSLRWVNGTNLPWLRAPNLETIRCSSGHAISFMDIDNLALEIKAASEAAATGSLFYGPGGAADKVEYVRGQFYDPWHGVPAMTWLVEDPDVFQQYRGMVPGKRIRWFECMLPNYVAPRPMADVIRNIDTLERFVVHGVREAMLALAPLEKHVETLVELDVRDCNLTSERLVVFLEQCPRLQVFVADKVEAAVAARSRPWACCTSMRRLQVQFYVEELSLSPELDGVLEHLLERLAGFERLERFYMPEYWYRYGLDRLQTLTMVRDVQYTPASSVELLAVADAKWMVEHWPELTKVRVPVSTTDYKIPFEATSLLKTHGVECLFHVGEHPL
ncbi:hypothetical protein BGZ93_005126 [Podila epicladia]|nr:hypothetical protein BGZ92_000395 [Podila epicladia]KAG0096013.1 hypothetical protein BGZ93_005126 [Podila epicladia]